MQKGLTLLIDFDKTISPIHGFHLPPDPIVVESIKKLYEKYNITIYSCRSNLKICDEVDHMEMIKYLNTYNIPYDDISRDKPLYVALIDDRTYNPNHISWDEITNILLG